MHQHAHSSDNAERSNVMSEPGQAPRLPDQAGNIEDEVPPHLVAQMMQMIADLKRSGEVAADADDMAIMRSMHSEMMRERQAMIDQMAQTVTLISKAAPTPLTDDVKEQNLIQSTPGGHGHSLGHGISCEGKQAASISPVADLTMSVKNAIQNNPSSINDTDADGDTMLHRVCDVGHEQLAMLLIRHGANVNSLNNQGRPPAHIAAKAGHIMLIQLLIDGGANVNQRDINGWTALHHTAAGSAEYCPHTLHYLTECCGLDYAALTNEGQNVLHLIACDKKDNNQEMLSILLSKPQIDVGLVDKFGCNAVHYAAEHIQTYMVYKLISAGTSRLLVTTNSNGKTPLDIAKSHPKLEGFLMYQEMEGWVQKGLTYRPDRHRPLIYYQYLLAPICLFLMFIFASRWLTFQYQGFLALGGMLVYQLGIFKPSHRLNHISRLANPSRLGGWVSAILVVAYLSIDEQFTTCMGYHTLNTWQRVIHLAALYSTQFITLALFFKLTQNDPGFTYESKRKENGSYYTMYDLVHTFRRPGIWCPTCQLIPTKPSKHCKLCDRCVYWMDHHCLYTMKCVGYRNHWTFVWFNIIIVISQLLFLSLIPAYIVSVNYMISGMDQPVSVQSALLYIFKYNGLLFVMTLGVAGFMIFTVNLLYRSLSNLSNGYTTYFQPKEDAWTKHSSSLTAKQRLMNVLSFLKSGQIITKDPSFNM